MPARQKENLVGVLDFETDPFKTGRIPFPFASCIYFGRNDYSLLWEPDIIRKTLRALRRLPECTLYAHNGGRFDFHFLIEYAEPQEIQIRNGRVHSMKIGRVTLKDSFPLMPFALEEYKKTAIDYAIFERNKRNIPRNRAKIERYLLDDCIFLHELIGGFRDVVGPKDTIGGAAFFQMRELGLNIRSLSESHDAMFRPYFFGGRVQAFKKGFHVGRYKYIDLNSAYPFAMLHEHAHGGDFLRGERMPPKKYLPFSFLRVVADSHGALPLRAKDGSLDFPHVERTEFFATGWEIVAGLETKTLHVHDVLECWTPASTICFAEYVNTFFALRQQAKESGDKIKRLAYKYLLNSGYGKFAQNPREFKKYQLADYGVAIPGYDWEADFGGVSLWSKPAYNGFGFYDVATGASITGFVRALLWRAICNSRGVLYCDTDAILCKSTNVRLGENLGEWKLEGIAKCAAIAGKKLYAIEWEKPIDGEKYKIASKGARLTFSEIKSIVQGSIIEWENEAPTFSLDGARFVKRRIRAT